jgi:hypothetical protein
MLITTPYVRAKGAKARILSISTAACLSIALGPSWNAAALTLPPGSGESIVFKSFDGPNVPTNKEGIDYPTWSDGRGGEGGVFTSTIDAADKVAGAASLKLNLTSGLLYAQFNPYDGSGREFAHTYADNPSAWQRNTYNRWSFWIKTPVDRNNPYQTDGTQNANVGTYHKTLANPNYYSDEDGGGHLYYNQNWPLTGTWVNCTLNFYVDHWRGDSGGDEPSSAERVTGESNYNLFDTLTRFYFQANEAPTSGHPAIYHFDDITFYRQTNPEPGQQVRDVCSTFVPEANRVIVTWMRNKNENSVSHEVRYAFADIHKNGWASATPAPGGTITPPGYQGYNGMYYDTTALPLSGKSAVFLAIKPTANNPQNLFAQVVIPLADNGGSSPPALSPPQPPRNLRVIQ